MKILKNMFFFNFLVVLLQIYYVLSDRKKKEEMNILNFLPSNSLLYPLDFQKNWQASEPIPVSVHYTVPAYGYKDLIEALEYHNDLENHLKEREEIERRIISEQKRLEDNLWNKVQFLKTKDMMLKKKNSLRTYKSKI
ncbi:conserved Plasmodium protein, unknown function [Plasmodium gallinaceum]|uniref:Uncharacterized protein n=1 Tax=Plasmodium gallinaceum TaxID=5849 RepID=A0A1J1GT29_PLAGA|nr:conserved Plasmodium protein, unknown function [Plasmodium gallinaceum]CRG95686.1 conserved Plasmodium protein, unknown function [Plasmodium gallinaceum]